MTVSKKRVFVGDIQGCLDELQELLLKLGFDSSTHELWCVGDVVNRGPKSAETIRFLKKMHAGSVLGNHDLHLISVASGQRALKSRDTIQDILQAPDRDELLNWIQNRPLFKEWDDLLLIHAGLSPDFPKGMDSTAKSEIQIRKGHVPWHDRTLLFLSTARLCDQEGRMTKGLTPYGDFKPWHDFYHGPKKVICGHWAERGLLKTDKVIGLDTGCVWGRQLTAWVAEDDELFSVEAKEVYQQVRLAP